MSNHVNQWMSWEGGVDLVAATQAGLAMPNVIVHVARMVHTPVGSAPAGMIFWQPDPNAPPALMGFISTDLNVAKYFGPKIFAGTPFENAPVLQATIAIDISGDVATARISAGGFQLESKLSGLAEGALINRTPAAMTPFTQQGVERVAKSAEFRVNGEKVSILIPPVGISGGPAAVVSPCGLYAR